MKAVFYFAILRNEFNRIIKDLERLNEMKARATSCGSFKYSDDPAIQRSMSDDQLSRVVVNYVDFSDQLNKRIARYQARRAKAVGQIQQMDDELQAAVLMKYYVEFKPMTQVAKEIKKSESHTYLLKRKALNNFEQLLT